MYELTFKNAVCKTTNKKATGVESESSLSDISIHSPIRPVNPPTIDSK